MNQALEIFRTIDKEFQPSASWWAQELGISERHVVRLRHVETHPSFEIAQSIIDLEERINKGEVHPPSRTQVRRQKIGSSGYRGVTFSEPQNLWRSQMTVNGKTNTSYFPTPEHAVMEYNRLAKKFGRWPLLNPPPFLPVFDCDACGTESALVFNVRTRPVHFKKKWTDKRVMCRRCLTESFSRGQWEYDRDFYKYEFPKWSESMKKLAKDLPYPLHESFSVIPGYDCSPVRSRGGAVWLAVVISAYLEFQRLHESPEGPPEEEYHVPKEDILLYANRLNGVRDVLDPKQQRVNSRWIGKCTANRPQAKYNYLRKTSEGWLRLTIPGECGEVRELPEDLLELNQVVLKSPEYGIEVTYGDLLNWFHNTYIPFLKRLSFKQEDDAPQEQTGEEEAIPDTPGTVRDDRGHKDIRAQLLRLKNRRFWGWKMMSREFERVMGSECPSVTTLINYATGKSKRRNRIIERYIAEAIMRIHRVERYIEEMLSKTSPPE